jgi:hypothetical protein
VPRLTWVSELKAAATFAHCLVALLLVIQLHGAPPAVRVDRGLSRRQRQARMSVARPPGSGPSSLVKQPASPQTRLRARPELRPSNLLAAETTFGCVQVNKKPRRAGRLKRAGRGPLKGPFARALHHPRTSHAHGDPIDPRHRRQIHAGAQRIEHCFSSWYELVSRVHGGTRGLSLPSAAHNLRGCGLLARSQMRVNSQSRAPGVTDAPSPNS